MNHLELFSGTHSFGKISSKEDIMTWDYKKYDTGYFKIITASPVCLWWSNLRCSWIGRKLKSHGDKIITMQELQQDIDMYGKPMVDKVFEIIDYFKPKYWILENPQGSKMKHYIAEKYPHYNTYNDFSYCKFSDWGYQKNTRFWNNIDGLENKLCQKDCENIITIKKQNLQIKKKHKVSVDGGKGKNNIYSQFGTNSKYERYRIPEKLINYLFYKL